MYNQIKLYLFMQLLVNKSYTPIILLRTIEQLFLFYSPFIITSMCCVIIMSSVVFSSVNRVSTCRLRYIRKSKHSSIRRQALDRNVWILQIASTLKITAVCKCDGTYYFRYAKLSDFEYTPASEFLNNADW
jgi:hypothetical protein